MKEYKKSHWTPVEDKPEKKAKVVKEAMPDPAKWHGWATPVQCVEMMDEMVDWLQMGGHPCPFKRQ